jgi:hypothetical protein
MEKYEERFNKEQPYKFGKGYEVVDIWEPYNHRCQTYVPFRLGDIEGIKPLAKYGYSKL